jgi:excinuclease UvrABC helicase subunit UvrB
VNTSKSRIPATAQHYSDRREADPPPKLRQIDRILNGPDPPFDMEQALQKVTSIAPPVTETLAEEEQEQKFTQLEQDLYQAVKQQDYTKAAATKKEISQLQMDDFGAVLQVNAAFYRAFTKKDFDAMQSICLMEYMHSSIPQPLSDPNRS